MHLAIDLRFYRPEPYGLAVYIRDLFTELVPMLVRDRKFEKITLIMDKQIKDDDLDKHLSWWPLIGSNDKFEVYWSSSRYYSLKEQTWFLWEMHQVKPDLTFFFNFNFPLLFPAPFIYQNLDFTIPKTKPFSLGLLTAKLLIHVGLRRTKHAVFLGGQTQQDAETFSGLNFSKPKESGYRKNTVVYAGAGPHYFYQPSANIEKSKIIDLSTTKQVIQRLESLKSEYKITKPYFLFVSVWRKYKNVEGLVEAFEFFNKKQDGKYQLVLAGKQDPKYPEIWESVQANPEYQRGNIVVPGAVNDEDLVALQDGALAYISPSKNEGFGLTLVEAAARATPVLCSDIPVFREIMPAKGALFFDPNSVQSMVDCLDIFTGLNQEQVQAMVTAGYNNSLKYTWYKTARKMLQIFGETADQLTA